MAKPVLGSGAKFKSTHKQAKTKESLDHDVMKNMTPVQMIAYKKKKKK